MHVTLRRKTQLRTAKPAPTGRPVKRPNRPKEALGQPRLGTSNQRQETLLQQPYSTSTRIEIARGFADGRRSDQNNNNPASPPPRTRSCHAVALRLAGDHSARSAASSAIETAPSTSPPPELLCQPGLFHAKRCGSGFQAQCVGTTHDAGPRWEDNVVKQVGRLGLRTNLKSRADHQRRRGWSKSYRQCPVLHYQ